MNASIRHVWWSSVVTLVGGLVLGACVDGAPRPEVGTAAFKRSTGPLLDDSAFASGGGGKGAAGPAVTGEQPVQKPQGGAGTAPMTTAGTGGAKSPTNSGAGGAGGKTGASGSGGSSVMVGSGGATSTASAGELAVTFTSKSQGGNYSPLNVGAVWIETGSGTFVKTLERWAGIRATHLAVWAGASGGWGSFFGGGNAADKADAISRATLSRHEAHMLTWDMQDLMGKLVPDGKYKIGIEVADDNFAKAGSGYVEFEKGPSGSMVMAPDQVPFTGLVIRYQP